MYVDCVQQCSCGLSRRVACVRWHYVTHRTVLQRDGAPAQSRQCHRRSFCCWCCRPTLWTAAGSWEGREVERTTRPRESLHVWQGLQHKGEGKHWITFSWVSTIILLNAIIISQHLCSCLWRCDSGFSIDNVRGLPAERRNDRKESCHTYCLWPSQGT